MNVKTSKIYKVVVTSLRLNRKSFFIKIKLCKRLYYIRGFIIGWISRFTTSEFRVVYTFTMLFTFPYNVTNKNYPTGKPRYQNLKQSQVRLQILWFKFIFNFLSLLIVHVDSIRLKMCTKVTWWVSPKQGLNIEWQSII